MIYEASSGEYTVVGLDKVTNLRNAVRLDWILWVGQLVYDLRSTMNAKRIA